MVSLLLSRGASLSMRTAHGDTLLHSALQADIGEAADLLQLGADPNLVDPNGNDFLNRVLIAQKDYELGRRPSGTVRDRLRILKLALSHHARPLLPNRDGMDAVELARALSDRRFLRELNQGKEGLHARSVYM